MGIQTVSQALSNENGGFSPFGFKNRIINGAMVIDQRNAGASVTPNGTYTLDRWYGDNSQTGKFTVQQNAGAVTPPAGFINYLGVTSSSPGYSLLTTDEFRIGQQIEGLNVADLAWGTASAATVTLTFWVRSSLTGAFGGALGNSANNRSYPFTYTISVANTWEQKTVTIAGDTSGTWLTTNGKGINVQFSLGCGSTYSGTANIWAGAFYIQPTGSTSVVSTSGATFYVTGVQLEKAPQATAFDYRDYGNELRMCQRYFLKDLQDGSTATFLVGVINTATTGNRMSRVFPVTMRTAPTAAIGGTSNPRIYDGTTPALITGLTTNTCSSFGASLQLEATSGGLVVGRGAVIIDNTASFVTYSAEL